MKRAQSLGEPEARARTRSVGRPGVSPALILRALTLPASLLMFVALVGQVDAGPVTSFNDILFWTGSGSNEAALVLDWQGNSTLDNSLAWGFRWDGPAKTLDMLTAIVATDSRLYAKIGDVGGFGIGVFGLGYDANNDGEFAIDDGTSFDEQGFANTEPADGAQSINAEDFYEEGWFVSGFWQYGVGTGNPFDGGTWVRSGAGISSRDVLDESWHSLAFTPTFSNQAFARNPLAAEPTGNADFDADGDIDGRDFLSWQRGYGIITGASRAEGDANGDGAVNAADLSFWQAQYGINSDELSALTGGALQNATLVVPEPTSLGCLCLAVGAWSVFSRCSRITPGN
jgi:hypothetical protein